MGARLPAGSDPAARRAVSAARIAALPATHKGQAAPGWEEPPDSAASRAALDRREPDRSARQDGWWSSAAMGALSIPAISSVAGTSNRTFYEHFESKDEAFLASYAALKERALARTAAAFQARG